MRSHWALDPAVTFLNHGSFGSCPRVVLEEQSRLRERLERQPVTFLVREIAALLGAARAALAAFVGADPDDLAFVTNATSGVNAVVRSLEFKPGDELLTTDHAYNACRNALEYAAARAGAKVVVAAVPFPVASADAVASAVLDRVTARTRLALIDHVTSPTALVFPVDRLVRELESRGVEALVDGAHAPGMFPLDLRALGASYYTGNCHKWICAPKGAAFLHVRRDRQERVHPTIISHGANAPLAGRSRFRHEFDWTGTGDITPYLCVPAALRFMGSLLPGGWPEVMERNRRGAIDGRTILCEALGVAPPCPESMLGSMAAVRLPDAPPGTVLNAARLDPLQEELLARHGIEVPIVPFPDLPGRLVRISSQLYNDLDQVRALAVALTRPH